MSSPSITKCFDFVEGANGFVAGFSDYPPGEEEFYELKSGLQPLPAELGVAGSGFLLSGNNHSDDLFMFLRRKLGPTDGVVPHGKYMVRFRVTFASNAPSGAAGIGGSPGNSVYLKVGATGIEPMAVIRDGDLRMNIDKGEQAQGGSGASVAGNIANGRRPEEPLLYVSIERDHKHPEPVQADSRGAIWVLVGTDSGFEGKTTLFYQQIEVVLEPQ